jgi:hypothetical protein
LNVDEQAEEVDVMPTCFMPEGTPGLNVSHFLELLARSPETAGYSLSGVTGVKRLPDGGRAQRSNGVIGTYVVAEDKEYWLLLAPESQWPPHWFGT